MDTHIGDFSCVEDGNFGTSYGQFTEAKAGNGSAEEMIKNQ